MAIQWNGASGPTAAGTAFCSADRARVFLLLLLCMFATDRIITGIDVGTHAVKVVVARAPGVPQQRSVPQIIGTGYAESRDVRHGYIVGSAAEKSIRAALAEAEQAAGVALRRAYLAVGGIGLDELRSRG